MLNNKDGKKSPYEQMMSPITFFRNDAGGSQPTTYGYEATLLIDLCDAVIKAGENGVAQSVSFAFFILFFE